MGPSSSFSSFVFRSNSNRLYLIIALIGGLIQFVIFKHFYPFPDFISDSYSYIDTNLHDMHVNLWPVGYSKFLAFIHLITPSHVALVYIQYYMMVLAFLYFFFTIRYLVGLTTGYSIVLFIFLFFNPLFLVLANCVLSDAIFCMISMVLFTQYIWMFYRPRLVHVVLQALLIGIAFGIRYTAIYYPVVSIIVLLLTGYKWSVKIAGILLPWLLIVPFIVYTQQETKKLTGTAEFSVFGGWQLANNAMYMYGHIDVDTAHLPPGTRSLDSMTRAFWAKQAPTEEELASVQGTFFIKVPDAVLKPYMYLHGWTQLPGAPGMFQAWGSVSPAYNAYGKWLITRHPIAFSRYYLWPNVKNYFNPYLEKFGSYNIGSRKVWKPAVTWFQLPAKEVTLIPDIDFQGRVFRHFPLLFSGLNFYFIVCALFFLTNRKLKKQHTLFSVILLFVISFLIINFCFSVFATPVVLRYQVLPMIILLTFSLLLTEKQFSGA